MVGLEHEWPGEGHKEKGLRICNALWEYCINKQTFVPLIGDWVGGPGERCGPLPDVCYYDITRPSDFCLTHFLLFSQVRSRACHELPPLDAHGMYNLASGSHCPSCLSILKQRESPNYSSAPRVHAH